MTNDNDNDNKPKKSNVIPLFKTQTGNSKKKTSATKITAVNSIKNSVINGGVKNVAIEENHYHGNAKPKRQKVEKRPPLTVEQGGITSGNKAIIKFFIDRWVEMKIVSGVSEEEKSSLYSQIYSKTFRKATSAGKLGVTNINEFPDCDFWKAETFLVQQIGITVRNSEDCRRHVNRENWLKQEIHRRFDELKINERDRRNYQLHHYGFDSLKYFTLEQLEKMYNAIMQPNHDFNVGVDYFDKNEEPTEAFSYPTMQKQRENVVAEWLTELQANDPTIDINNLPYKQETVLEILQTKSDLFDIKLATFAKFWKAQKLCKLKAPKK